MNENPFGVFNPEQLDADYIAKNFVDIYTDLPRLRDFSNTFILGARGTGKSMLLRSLEPQVMLKSHKAERIEDLPYLGVHVPLKKAEFGVTELQRLAGYAGISVGEHLLIMQAMFRISEFLVSVSESIETDAADNFCEYFSDLYVACGGTLKSDAAKSKDCSDAKFETVKKICEREILLVRQYYTRLPFATSQPDYKGSLTGFLDFLIPITREIRHLAGLPNVPFFLMLDDADNLPQHMQKIVNSWVSTRSTNDICLKITTQLGYATHRTIDDRVIESPHDFSEINLSTIYTREQETYSNRIREIVARRLLNAGIERSAADFFPRDEAQRKRLTEIENEIRVERTAEIESGSSKKGSSRVRDAVTRYAVPRLMRELTGSSRSSHTYSYAGFDSMVDLSAGVVRWFLEPASRMYDHVLAQGSPTISHIPVAVQDSVLLDWSKEFLNSLDNRPDSPDEDRIQRDPDASLHAFGHESEMYGQLRNLLEGLGKLYRQKLMTENASEQRLFSFIMKDRAQGRLKDVLGLAVRLGYLQLADYAAKETFGGRIPRYILARRLAPYFRLDVSGYAAHISIMPRDLEIAMDNPAGFVSARLKEDPTEGSQLALGLERVTDGSIH